MIDRLLLWSPLLLVLVGAIFLSPNLSVATPTTPAKCGGKDNPCFLTRIDNGVRGFGSTQAAKAETDAHYRVLALRGKGYATLNDFRNANGFGLADGGSDPANKVSTVTFSTFARYYNAGDLDLGRDMHCRVLRKAAGARIACLVANYGPPPGACSRNDPAVCHPNKQRALADLVVSTLPVQKKGDRPVPELPPGGVKDFTGPYEGVPVPVQPIDIGSARAFATVAMEWEPAIFQRSIVVNRSTPSATVCGSATPPQNAGSLSQGECEGGVYPGDKVEITVHGAFGQYATLPQPTLVAFLLGKPSNTRLTSVSLKTQRYQRTVSGTIANTTQEASELRVALVPHAPGASISQFGNYTVTVKVTRANDVVLYIFDEKGNRLPTAALDSEDGQPGDPNEKGKPVPQMCMSCHGGNYDEQTHTVSNVRFLPFDLNAFDFASRPGYTRQVQEEQFRKLNEIVHATVPPGNPIANLIEGWYRAGGVSTPGTVYQGDFAPADWPSVSPGAPDDPRGFYLGVIAPYCRSCHVALTNGPYLERIADLRTFKIQMRREICGDSSMPHSEVQFKKLWADNAATGGKIAQRLNSPSGVLGPNPQGANGQSSHAVCP